MIDATIFFYACSALLVILLVYIQFFANYPDVDEYFLYHQASVGSIRRPGETAIHRSLVAGHSRPLMSGLSIADEKNKLRDGSVHDLFKLAEKSTISVAHSRLVNGKSTHYRKELPRNELIQLINVFGNEFKRLCIAEKHVAILLPPCLEALVVQFACSFFDCVPVYVPTDGVSAQTLQNWLQFLNPNVIVGYGDILDKLTLGSIGSVKAIIPIRSSYEKRTKNVEVIPWSSVVIGTSEVELPEIDESSIYSAAKFVIGDDVTDIKVSSFSHQSIVSAIAAQIKILPKSQAWKQTDSVLIFTPEMTSTTLIMQMSAFAAGSGLIFPESIYAIDSPTSLVADLRPTIMITDDHTCSTLAYSRESLNIIGNLFLHLNQVELSHNKLPKSAVQKAFKSLRLIYSDKSKYGHELSTSEANYVRALTGSRVIHSRSSPYECGPVCQTGFYDYRQELDPQYQNFGPILPCYEALIKDFNMLKAENREGQLWIRGPALASGVEWLNTEIVGKIGADGCFRELVAFENSSETE